MTTKPEETDLTELVFILDRSGSMAGLESDTVGGYNSFLAKQKAEPGEAKITTVLFDDQYQLLHDRIDLRAVSPITEKDYFVRGSTALIDAIGTTIDKIVAVQRKTDAAYRADKVLFVIITDGMENASRRYTVSQVRRKIEHEKDKYGWEFIFLGANIDAVETAGHFGIDAHRAHNFHSDARGTANNWGAVSRAAVAFCAAPPSMASAALDNSGYDQMIDADFDSRNSNGNSWPDYGHNADQQDGSKRKSGHRLPSFLRR